MSVTSASFAVFLLAGLALYWLTPAKLKPWMLLLQSAAFYAVYNAKLLVFMALFAAAVWFVTLKIASSEKRRGLLTALSVAAIAALYFALRYSNALNSLLRYITSPLGVDIRIVFPLGFSYCMFRCISYIFDVRDGKLEAERRLDRFLLYFLYFPDISLGPITRAVDFLPQIAVEKRLSREDAVYGFAMILWGLVKKLVFADRLAALIAPYYASPESFAGSGEWLIVLLSYLIQLYLDFSGYTDISVGVSRLYGYRIKHNFRAPLIADSMSEYWRRWHMSLSLWLSDYVFTPLQFNFRQLGIWASALAAIITLVVSGLWHAVSAGFLIWGFLMGLLVAFDALTARKRKKLKKGKTKLPYYIIAILLTNLVNILILAFTRASSAADAAYILMRVFSFGADTSSVMTLLPWLMACIGATAVSHVFDLKRDEALERAAALPAVVRYICYIALIYVIILGGVYGSAAGGFIYANF